MKFITNLLVRMGVLRDDLDYHLIRASMVIIFLFFGYQTEVFLRLRGGAGPCCAKLHPANDKRCIFHHG